MREIWQALEKKEAFLVTDFDKTLTLSGSSMNSVVHVLGKESGYAADRNRLYETYGWCRRATREMSQAAKETAEEWWKAQMELLVAWDISEDVLKRTAEELPPREELLLLLKKCEKYKKIVWIVSSGLENVIQYWLKNYQISSECVRILANHLVYEDRHPTGYGKIVTDWNKKETFTSEWRKQGEQGFPVFLGDRQGDLNLAEPGISFLIGDDKEK